ncbi:hybrid sensor histidine kinase/response regulator [Azospirillum sp. SYSU D00513]|uniref:ATP-binding response regulator n=1 Tax=Azospirillum sp. SYSU D00513 TaxID=2812561 RepID=UPI0032B4218A
MTFRPHDEQAVSPVREESDCIGNARRICDLCAVPALLVTGLPDDDALVHGNAALAALLGHRPLSGSGPAHAYLQDAWPSVAAALRPLFAPGGAGLSEGVPLAVESLPGQTEPLPMRAVPLVERGRVVGALAMAATDDVTGRMAKAMRAEIDRTTAARSRFLAAASHDLRQPFQAMRLFLDALNAQIKEEKPRRTAEMLGNAMTAGEQLLNALLDISTLDAGTVKAEIRTFALDEMLGQLVEEFRPQVKEKGLELRVHLQPGFTTSDPVLLGRIVRNLMTNAIRYTQRGGLMLSMRRRGNRWRVEVWDTGFGIPDEQQQAIFDEFHQLSNPSRDPTRGLGLGLAIVRRLSELLNAPVDIRSEVGRGSVFAVTVERIEAEPAEKPARDARESSPEADSAVADLTVLAVDDDAMVLSGLELILQGWGCKVVAVTSMREVFAALDGLDEPPDAILTDLRLTGNVSGFDVIDRVRRLYKRDIPAVVLSGETAQETLIEGRNRGCAFLHKPIHPDELKQVLEQVSRKG